MSSLSGSFAQTGRFKMPKSTGMEAVNIPTMNQGQMDLFNQLMQGTSKGVGGGLEHLSSLASGGTPEMWQQLEAPAMRQFAGLQGNIASRFSGMGSGARNSSGFQNMQSEAGADLAERLASKRMGLQNDAISQLLGLSNQLLGHKTFETGLMPKKKSFLEQLLASLGGPAAQTASMAAFKGMGMF